MSQQRRDDYFSDTKHCVDSHDQHIAIVRAIDDRDTSKAIDLMNSHIGRVERHYLTSLPVEEPRNAS